ncbi:glycosyltransferase family 4 protein [Maricaulis parjimensis]|uniref:glycosyltransferase family 4 protein n=1 Tax=Maricaulis parjimensis TaxID=144023 RepID=UPI00193A4F83|nr:glycosyltransferase family 4 protein [Maricaulis parjimensis]
MRILLHDYAGHPFQAELSRRLARRGHQVLHAFFAGDAGPKGRMTRQLDDPATLDFAAIETPGDYSKTNFIKRRSGDIAYGKALAARILADRPDIVISGNTPTEAQEPVLKACRTAGAGFVFWCQDFYSIAAARLLHRKLPGPGHLVGAWYTFLDRRQMRSADHIVLITDAFRAQTSAWGIPEDRISVIPNWGAIDEIPVQDKQNSWADEHGLSGRPVCLYTGTLALKHDPRLLEAIARSGLADMVVVAFGVGKDALESVKARDGLDRLHLLPLQPFDRFAEVLGSADVLTAVIEEEAGEFSVPSKVLSYLCAGRPIILSAPKDNLAAQIIAQSGAGIVVGPGDTDGFVTAAQSYLDNPAEAARAGKAGRAYAEANFDLDRVADRFEAVFERALSARDAA